MGPTIIARNYAETLLLLAQKHGGNEAVDAYARAIDEVTGLLQSEPRVREFLETPRVGVEAKKHALRASLQGRVPDFFLRFLLVVVEKRRQALLTRIGAEYHALVDQLRNRVRAEIIVAREADAGLRAEIVSALERRLGKEVIPTFRVDPEILGGVVIRVADRLYDGSLRRRVSALRRRLLELELSSAVA